MAAANWHYVSITPAGGSEYLLHALISGASVITSAKYSNPLDIAEIKLSSNDVANLPNPDRVAQAEDTKLNLTLKNSGEVFNFLQACKGKVCAVKYRESVADKSGTNPEAQYNGMSNNGGELGGQVAGGHTTVDVEFALCDGVAPVYDTTP